MKKVFPIMTGAVVVAILAAVGMLWFGTSRPVEAFTHGWSLDEHTGVSSYGLWDDLPGGSLPGVPTNAKGMPKSCNPNCPVNNEAGLLWFANKNGGQDLNYSTGVAVDTNAYPTLEVRAAVSDSSVLTVSAFHFVVDDNLWNCGSQPSTQRVVTWSGNDANGIYKTKTVNLQGLNVNMICITLSKSASTVKTGRSSALIDYIYVKNASNALGWREDFTGAP